MIETLLARFKGSQLANASIILREFRNAGFSDNLAAAAIVNAFYESGLRSDAVGDGGRSVGLFQINDLGGKRTFTGDRRDPAYNTQWIIQEVRDNWNRTKTNASKAFQPAQNYVGESLASIYGRGGSVADLTRAFAAFVERPGKTKTDAETRASAAKAWLGSSAVSSNLSASVLPGMLVQALPTTFTPDYWGSSRWLWVAPVLITGLGFLLVAWLRRSRSTKPLLAI